MLMTAYLIALASISLLILLCLPTLIDERYRIFPPPHIGCWQHHLFWTLFRVFMAGLIIVSAADFDRAPINGLRIMGCALMVVGIGSAAYLSYVNLGKHNAYGGTGELKTQGPYRFSRNPIYVVSFLGMLGWALFVHSKYVSTLLLCWSLMYLVAPFIEEPWLEKQYGSKYREYKSRTPRFLGFRK